MPSPPPSHLAALLRARRRAAQNAFTRGGARTTLLLGGLALTVLGLAGGAGALAAPALARAAAAPPTPGFEPPSPGGPYTELGFWLGALAIFAFSFRIMEALYRKQDVRLLAMWPVQLGALFAYRLLAAAGEVAAGALAIFAFMGAVFARTGDSRALLGAGIAAGGLLACLTLGFAVQLGAGRYALGGRGAAAQVGQIDVGGFAAAFYYAPAVALVASLSALLLLDLAVANELLQRGPTRLFWTAVGLVVAACVVAVGVARQMFLRHYPWLLARFYESDLIQITSGYDFQRSDKAEGRPLWERALPAGALPLYRRDVLQYKRRHPMLRLLTVAGWIGVGVAAATQAAALPLLAAAPTVLLCAVVAPWARMASPELDAGVSATLPIRPEDARAARQRAGLRESLGIATPAALLLAALGAALGDWTAPLWALGGLIVALGAAHLLASLTTPSRRALVHALGVLVSAAAIIAGQLFTQEIFS